MGTRRTYSVANLLRENTQLTIRSELAVTMLKRAEGLLHEYCLDKESGKLGNLTPEELKAHAEAWLSAFDHHFGAERQG